MLTLDLLTTKTKRCFIDSYLHNLQFPFCSWVNHWKERVFPMITWGGKPRWSETHPTESSHTHSDSVWEDWTTVAKSAITLGFFFCKVAGKNPWSRVAVFWAYFKKYGCLLGKSDKQLRFFIYVRRSNALIDTVCSQLTANHNQCNNISAVE